MPLSEVVDPDELKILRKVLEDHCGERGIVAENDRTAIAHRIMGLYKNGVTSAEELAAALQGTRPE